MRVHDTSWSDYATTTRTTVRYEGVTFDLSDLFSDECCDDGSCMAHDRY